jgi:hypothetical protein
MRNKVFLPVLVSLFLLVPLRVTAQNTPGSSELNTTGLPQWVKDMRRWDIIAFGSFPFAMLFSTIIMDTYRWSKYSGFSDNRYAPWPIKSAGAFSMEPNEFVTTMIIAASMSVTIAFTDLIIVKIKQNRERRRIESMPEGSAIIIRTPYSNPSYEFPPEAGESEEDSEDSSDLRDEDPVPE